MATLQFSFPCLDAKAAKPGLLDITGLGHTFDFRPDQPQKLIIVNMWRAIGGAPIRQKLSLVHPDGDEIFAAEAEVTASDEGTAIVTQVEFGPIPPGTYYIRVHESGEVEPKVEYPVVLTMRAR